MRIADSTVMKLACKDVTVLLHTKVFERCCCCFILMNIQVLSKTSHVLHEAKAADKVME